MGSNSSTPSKPSNSSGSSLNVQSPVPAPVQAPAAPVPTPTGGRRHSKRRGGVAPLSVFNAPQHQPSQRIMNWATTAGGSRRKHKSRKHKSRRHRK